MFSNSVGVIEKGFTLISAEHLVLLGIIYLGVLWIALIIWVTKDITNRTHNLVFQICSILLIVIFTPLFGLLLYLILRPTKTLMDRYVEELIEEEILKSEREEEEKHKRHALHHPHEEKKKPIHSHHKEK